MVPFTPPSRDMSFALKSVVGLGRLAALEGREAATEDLIGAVLDEAGRLCAEVLAPLNVVGDRQPSRLENGAVRTPPGFREAYETYAAGGWNGLSVEQDRGGQGLPFALHAAVMEMVQSSCLAFGLCPMLTLSAIEALLAKGSDEQCATYLGNLLTGEWTGTMVLTEPQAGSDLAQIRTRAERRDGHYRLFGQKIFITWGDHDVADNTVHMVLARCPDAPPGVKGISLFIVPKFLVKADGSLGDRNDVRPVSLEHKMGIHASPTCVMSFGDNDGAIGYLVGEENRGLEYMFIMMNNARLAVGLQGVAIAERAYQQARDYARNRVQGRSVDGESGTIIVHPDVRRMLLTMKALTEASRALAYMAYLALDEAKHHSTAEGRRAAQARVDLLTPVVKAWSTDIGNEVASLGVQIHGGMGFIEETGAAQHFRDARILPIYEGTNGIQANDLVFRKVVRDDGASAGVFIAEIRAFLKEVADLPGDDIAGIGYGLAAAVGVLEKATEWLTLTGRSDQYAVAAASVPYLKLFGLVGGGYVMAKMARAALEGLAARDGDAGFLESKLLTARFFAESILPQTEGLLQPMMAAHRSIRAFSDDSF